MPISLSPVLSFVHFLFIPVCKTERKFNIPTPSNCITVISKYTCSLKKVHINPQISEINIFFWKNKKPTNSI